MRPRKLILITAVVILVAIALPLTVLAMSNVADDTSSTTEVLGPNLLTNGGMDGKYVKQCSMRDGSPWVQVPCPADYNAVVSTVKQWETTQVPSGWSAWWREPNTNFDDPNYFSTWPAYCPFNRKSTPADCIAHHNPEFRDTLGGPQETGPSRKVAGDNSQKYFTFYSIHEAGLYQVVAGVQPGDRLRFSVYMEGWSTGTNDPYQSDHNQHMNFQVGIDPTGGNNPWSSNIVWTAPAESFDQFTQFSVEAIAQNNVVSVWTKSAPELALQHVDVYVDEASLNVVQSTGTTNPPVKSNRSVPKIRYITKVYPELNPDGSISRVVITVPVVTTVPTTVATRSTGNVRTVTSTTAPTPSSGTSSIPASGTYTVVRGDTLIAIARRFGITPWRRLAELNNLTEPYRIDAGQVLLLR